jgi:hypothetical protein
MRWILFFIPFVLLCRNVGFVFGCPRSADKMCLQHSRARLSPDEELAAEESFALYCKPVELYNIIQRRAIKNVNVTLQLFLTLFPYWCRLAICHVLMCKCYEIWMMILWILQPPFLQRNLLYKIHARRKKRFSLWMKTVVISLNIATLYTYYSMLGSTVQEQIWYLYPVYSMS